MFAHNMGQASVKVCAGPEYGVPGELVIHHMRLLMAEDSPYTNSTYSAPLVPRWLLASQRYVPLSVLLSVVMVSSLPSTIIRSMSGSSPPSLDHSTGSGLWEKTGGTKHNDHCIILAGRVLESLFYLQKSSNI